MILSFLFFVVALSGPTMAETLDLETATRLVKERALDATGAELSVSRQEIARTAARRAWTPSASLRASGQGSLGRTFSEQLGTNVTAPTASLSTSLMASMSLYEGGALRAGREEAEATLGVAEADREQTLQDLRWLVADELLAIEQARNAVEVQVAALEADRALLEQVALQVEAGSHTPADGFTQQALVSSREASLASARRALTEAELQLLALLRLDPGQGWSFEPPPELGAAGVEGSLIADALEHRPGLRGTQESITASMAARDSARSGFLPSLSLGAGTSTSWLTSSSDPFATQLDDQARGWVALELNVPLLDGGVRRAALDTAVVGVREAELEQQRRADQVALEVRLLLAQEEAAGAAMDASAAAVKAARQATEVLSLRYQAGSETLVSLTQARADFVDAQLKHAWNESALQRVRYQLDWAVGSLGDV